MCTLAIYFRTHPEYPVVVAANRDEFYSRPTHPPARLAAVRLAAVRPAGDPWIVAGTDAVAGGTWLGVNAHALVAGILNRRTHSLPDPTRCSRGLLCLEVLRHASVDAARTRVCGEPGSAYNPFNLLIASPEAACVVGNVSGAMLPTVLEPGLHLLTNLELNDAECPRIAKSYGLFDDARRQLRAETLEVFLAGLRRILSDHSTPLDPRSTGLSNNLCVHSEHFGTRSSSVLVYSASAGCYRMWHANGAPCETDYAEVPLPRFTAAPSGTAGQLRGT